MVTKKKQKILPRRIRTGLAAAPTDSFRWFYNYLRLDVQRKDLAAIIRNYIRKHHKGEEQKILLAGPEWIYGGMPGVAASIEWMNRGLDLPKDWNFDKQWKDYTNEVKFWVDKKKAERNDSDKPKAPARAPIDYLQEKTANFLGHVDGIIDEWKENKDWSMYEELLKENASTYTAKAALDYYNKQRLELEELIKSKTPILVEAYSHMSKADQKAFFAFYERIVSDVKKYMLSKKAQRKPQAPRVKSADKQVAKVQYCKASADYKLTSIDPINIIGMHRLYAFNIKDRTVIEYTTDEITGFQINGTTIKNFDPENSRAIRLRKPEEALIIFQTKTWRQIDKYWKTLTTKTTVPNGRLNKDTVLLRVLDQ